MKRKGLFCLGLIFLFCLTLVGCDSNTEVDTSVTIKEIYGEAVENGFTGTYEEWLSSIKGEKGDKGDQGEQGNQGDKGEDGVSPILKINSETNMWEISYDNGTTWTSLEVKATGEKGENGNNGVTPKLKIDAISNIWYISYDDGQTWSSLDVKASGARGEKGETGITPELQINSETNEWEVSYDNGQTWKSLGIKATGDKGATGDIGKDGNNGITPKLQINAETDMWEVSYDNGTTWTSLDVKASGSDAITYVPVIFNNYDGTMLFTFYYEYGTDITYEGTEPTRAQERVGTTVTEYTFTGWDKPLTNITKPTIFTAQYSSTTFTGYKVTFLDSNDNLLYEHYYQAKKNVVYPFDQPFSYDSTNVYQFAGWSESLTSLSSDMTVKAQMVTIPRSQCGEYPQSLVTDETIITALNNITETNEQGYKVYANEKYASLEGGAYTDNQGNEVTAGVHYYKVEPIQWRWLKTDTNSIYVFSKYIIDWQVYNTNYSGTQERTDYNGNTATVYANNYKYSNIRTWLNTTFLNAAFTDSSSIKTVTIYNGSTESNQYACETTTDKIFLLSSDENSASTYFNYLSINDDMKATTTEYARAKWALSQYKDDLENTYMTRTPSKTQSSHIYDVNNSGKITANYNIGYAKGVRPALNFNVTFGE